MKTIIVGDIHGRSLWKQIVQQESDADRFIFLGDYFDSFDIPGIRQLENFQDILEFKQTSGKDIILLIGNHDYHYFPEIDESSTSGYQYTMAPSYKHILGDNRQHLQVAYRMGEFVFSHAGISSEWLDDVIPSWTVENMVDKVNEMFVNQPGNLCYRSYKIIDSEKGQWIGSGGYGNETYQGPMWIRPKALMQANKDTQNGRFTNKETLKNFVIQVVGHTHQLEIDKKGKSTGGRYYFVDVQETSEEYMIITDNKISFNKTK